MAGTTIEIEGHQLSLTNLEKVLYPSGFTKAQVIDYYVRIAPVILPHLQGRNLTTVRFPDGSTGKSFFAKNMVSFAPEWMKSVELKDNKYVVCEDVATLVFLANLAALELHIPMHRIATGSLEPDRIVFDLDPGPDVGIKQCCELAVEIGAVLTSVGMQLRPKTSGSKGLQLYAIPPTPMSYDGEGGTTAFAKALAEGMERAHPDRVVSKQNKELRSGKILIDWSQNVRPKTTVCVYSLRAKDRPTVSTPVTWDEVIAGASGEPLSFTSDDVLERVDRLGDLFA